MEVTMGIKYYLLGFVFLLGCQSNDNWVDTLPKPWTLSQEEVSDILPKFDLQPHMYATLFADIIGA